MMQLQSSHLSINVSEAMKNAMPLLSQRIDLSVKAATVNPRSTGSPSIETGISIIRTFSWFLYDNEFFFSTKCHE